jgi:hypothetical protein
VVYGLIGVVAGTSKWHHLKEIERIMFVAAEQGVSFRSHEFSMVNKVGYLAQAAVSSYKLSHVPPISRN